MAMKPKKMAMKPKKMRGGGMVKKMSGGGMAAPSGKELIRTTKLGALPSSPSATGKRAPTGRSGPNTAKVAMGKKANAVKKAGARRAGGGMPVGMSKGGKVGRKKK